MLLRVVLRAVDHSRVGALHDMRHYCALFIVVERLQSRKWLM